MNQMNCRHLSSEELPSVSIGINKTPQTNLGEGEVFKDWCGSVLVPIYKKSERSSEELVSQTLYPNSLVALSSTSVWTTK